MSLCLACGAANPLDTKFCSQCRTNLKIQDRYRALRIIGQGGFGKTFLAQDEGKPLTILCLGIPISASLSEISNSILNHNLLIPSANLESFLIR